MTRKATFFAGWSWFKFNNLGVALAIALKLCTNVAKRSKLKVKKFCGLILTFKVKVKKLQVKVKSYRGKTGKRTLFAPPPFPSPVPPYLPPWIWLSFIGYLMQQPINMFNVRYTWICVNITKFNFLILTLWKVDIIRIHNFSKAKETWLFCITENIQ